MRKYDQLIGNINGTTKMGFQNYYIKRNSLFAISVTLMYNHYKDVMSIEFLFKMIPDVVEYGNYV